MSRLRKRPSVTPCLGGFCCLPAPLVFHMALCLTLRLFTTPSVSVTARDTVNKVLAVRSLSRNAR
jgi:hypothetical protein